MSNFQTQKAEGKETSKKRKNDSVQQKELLEQWAEKDRVMVAISELKLDMEMKRGHTRVRSAKIVLLCEKSLRDLLPNKLVTGIMVWCDEGMQSRGK